MGDATPKKIVLADREPNSRKVEYEYLKEIGFGEIYQTDSGTEAWSMIKNFDADFVISTWHLREMNGLVLLKVIRADAAHASIPFLMLVEEVTKGQVVAAGEAGVNNMLLKPFTKAVFGAKISETIKPEDAPEIVESRRMYDTGLELMKQGSYEEALTSFKKILSIHESAEVYFNLGYIKTAQGQYEEAILAFRRATQINNAFAQAYQKMGEAYARLGRADEAQVCFEKAAEIFMEKNMEENAEAVFMQALEINPNTLNVYNSLGILYRRQGRFNDSIRMYQKALRVNPKDEHIMYNLARAFMAVKDLQNAASTLRIAVVINPDFREAQNMLTSLEVGQGLK